MNPDKFLTDLAALTGCETVNIEFRGYAGAPHAFTVSLFHRDDTQEHGWFLAHGDGPTVEAAMRQARARLAAHYDGAAA